MSQTHIPGITDLPPWSPGMRIGLFGGSFNPVHEGHKLVALQCLKRLQLDAVWLLVSPGNPLKSHEELAPLATRVTAVRALIDHPRVGATGIEAELGFTYTYDTLRHLVRACDGAKLVWIMGADSLKTFDQWERWEDIANLVPMAVYARPGSGLRATLAKAATVLKPYRLPEADAEALADRDPPAWVYLHGVTSAQSSTALRARGKLSSK